MPLRSAAGKTLALAAVLLATLGAGYYGGLHARPADPPWVPGSSRATCASRSRT